jgi:superfamily II DNA or RNA helicase
MPGRKINEGWETYSVYDSFFEQLNRKLFPQQKDISVAASKRLVVDNHVIISGQMGTGKTTLGVAACHHHANGKPYRTIVTCPGHLVEKWAREVKEIIPEAKVLNFFLASKARPVWISTPYRFCPEQISTRASPVPQQGSKQFEVPIKER